MGRKWIVEKLGKLGAVSRSCPKLKVEVGGESWGG